MDVNFIKFGKKENLEKLQRGEIYFKNLNYYSSLEESTGNSIIGDRNEGRHVLSEVTVNCYDKSSGKNILYLENANVLMNIEEVSKMPVFCMTVLSTNDMNYQGRKENTESYSFCYNDILKDVSGEDGWSSALVITNINEFLRRVEKACDRKNIKYLYKKIKYTNMGINYIDRFQDIEKCMYNIAFWKDVAYESQKEFRIALIEKEVEDHFILNIGDISDITLLFEGEEYNNLINNEIRMDIVYRKVLSDK